MQFRFMITDGDKDPFFTEWFEDTAGVTVQVAKKLRALYPDSALKIERSQKVPMPSPEERKEIEERWLAKPAEKADAG